MEDPSYDVASGHVITTDPPKDSTIKAGTEITLLLSSGPPTTSVLSEFSDDEENWRVANNTTPIPKHVKSGGKPGGYIFSEDDKSEAYWYWSAPDKFLGDKSRFRTLVFDLFQSNESNQANHPIPDVIVSNGEITLAYETTPNPRTDWTSYEIPLDRPTGWLTLTKPDGAEYRSPTDFLRDQTSSSVRECRPASAEELSKVLRSLNQLLIRGEYKFGSDSSGIDNVEFTTDTATLTGENAPLISGATVAAINSGGGSFVGSDGTFYVEDAFFDGGQIWQTGTPIEETDDDTIYQTERFSIGQFSYDIPLLALNTEYVLTLKFAEIFIVPNSYEQYPNQRVFDVSVEGKLEIIDLDISRGVGSNTAFDWNLPVSVCDRELNIDFLGKIENPKVSAIVVKAK